MNTFYDQWRKGNVTFAIAFIIFIFIVLSFSSCGVKTAIPVNDWDFVNDTIKIATNKGILNEVYEFDVTNGENAQWQLIKSYHTADYTLRMDSHYFASEEYEVKIFKGKRFFIRETCVFTDSSHFHFPTKEALNQYFLNL